MWVWSGHFKDIYCIGNVTTTSAPTDPAGNAGVGQAGTHLPSFSFLASPNSEGISAPAPPFLPPSVNAKLQITSPLGLKTRLSVLISILSCALNMAPAAAGLEDQKRGCCFFLSGWSDYFKRSRQVGFRDGVTVVQALQCGFKLVISQAYFKHFSKIRRENAFIFWGWKVWKWSKRMVDDLSQQVDSCFQWNWDPSLCRLVEDQCTEVVSAGPLTL